MFVCLEVQAKRAKTKRNVLVSDETSIASNGFLYWDATWIQQKAPQSRNVDQIRIG